MANFCRLQHAANREGGKPCTVDSRHALTVIIVSSLSAGTDARGPPTACYRQRWHKSQQYGYPSDGTVKTSAPHCATPRGIWTSLTTACRYIAGQTSFLEFHNQMSQQYRIQYQQLSRTIWRLMPLFR